jgi:ribosomal protein L25 (general stress protein Ctc)
LLQNSLKKSLQQDSAARTHINKGTARLKRQSEKIFAVVVGGAVSQQVQHLKRQVYLKSIETRAHVAANFTKVNVGTFR